MDKVGSVDVIRFKAEQFLEHINKEDLINYIIDREKKANKIDMLKQEIQEQLNFCEADAQDHKLCHIQVAFYRRLLKDMED
jgi:GTPase involved in cell partitioning and DNA repair